MQTWEATSGRSRTRGPPITDADLDQILEAGRRSPSSRNWQPWDFVVLTGRPGSELAKVWRGAGHVARSAATIALIAPGAGRRAAAVRSTTSARPR